MFMKKLSCAVVVTDGPKRSGSVSSLPPNYEAPKVFSNVDLLVHICGMNYAIK